MNKEIISIINEEEIVKSWKQNDIFIKSIDNNYKSFIFYDGPPFATGLPHYGHILAGFIKDTIGRFYTQNERSVNRKAGWDCHGLPIEYEIEKKYSIKRREDIEELGIDKYNQYCNDIVMTYSHEWEIIMERLGRWVDFKDNYKTMDFDYMNSVWWIFKQLYDKNMVYTSYRVMPYSVACRTPLSNFETQQNYQDIEDTTLYIKFKILQDIDCTQSIYLLVWTTTPWTLPSNLVLAVNKNIKYSKIEYDNNIYIIASSLIIKVFGMLKVTYNIINEFYGLELLDLKYMPLFYPYFSNENTHKVYHADYITDTDGTGIVHIAPSYGNEDYEVCIRNNIILKTDYLFMTIDDQGYFIKNLKDLEDIGGLFYKIYNKLNNEIDGNSIIIIKLKELGKIFYQKRYKHSYPFCWRSDTPLMYRAVKTWFINVESIKDRMVELNKTINWIPENIGKGRFHQWLLQAKDWCIARNRYWGTPIPIWQNVNDSSDYIVIGSANELELLCKLDKNSINNLHKDKIDKLTFEYNNNIYKRIPEIFDCWFESGSMPYASIGYPFKNTLNNFPADFIAEGIDQTRGWFYTLLIISTAIFDSIPFKNVIVNGLILASDGKKMSKRLQNYPDPMEIVKKYGSDALRLYLLNSQATKAEMLKFNELGVQSMVRDIIIPLKNSLNFLIEYITKFKIDNPNEELYNVLNYHTDNPLDSYAIKYIGLLIDSITNDISKYQLADSIRKINQVVEMLNNQYIKFNRFAIKGKNGFDSWKSSLSLLNILIQYISVKFASVIPFLSEYIWNKLYQHLSLSVHLTQFVDYQLPKYNYMADEMKHVINIINQVMSIRSKNNLSMKMPLENIIVRTSEDICNILKKYSNFIIDELNILDIIVDIFEWSEIELSIKPNFTEIKKVISINSDLDNIINIIQNLNKDQIQLLLQNQSIIDNSIVINPVMCNIIIKPNNINNYVSQYAFIDGYNYNVYLNIIISDRIRELSYAKLLASTFQKMRKYAKLHPWDPISLGYTGNLSYPICKLSYIIYSVCDCDMIDLTNKNINEYKIIYQYDPSDIKDIFNGLMLYLVSIT